nr:unnamed protein product [Spirometra erinaceieuropaei]
MESAPFQHVGIALTRSFSVRPPSPWTQPRPLTQGPPFHAYISSSLVANDGKRKWSFISHCLWRTRVFSSPLGPVTIQRDPCVRNARR